MRLGANFFRASGLLFKAPSCRLERTRRTASSRETPAAWRSEGDSFFFFSRLNATRPPPGGADAKLL